MQKICPVCGHNKSKKIFKYQGITFPFNIKSNLFRCFKCTFVFMYPTPTDKELIDFYNEYWFIDKPVQNFNKKNHYVQFESRLNYLISNNIKLNGKTFLDYGSGNCLFHKVLTDNNIINFEYYAIDTDNTVIDINQKKGIKIENRLSKYKGTKFDLILLFHIIEHLKTPIELLMSLRKYLQVGGDLFIEVPNQDFLWKKNIEPHISFFNMQSIEKLLTKAGYKIIKIETCGRKLDFLMKQKTKFKMLRYNIGNMLKKYKLIKQKDDIIIDRPKDLIKSEMEADTFGNNRQWIRVIAKK